MAIDELLILHHSHTDLGYLQNPGTLEVLQHRYIDEALDLIEATADRPEASQVRWTCEVAAIVLGWWNSRNPAQRERFLRWHRSGHLGVGAMAWNTTPLCGRRELEAQLEPLRRLRDNGIDTRVAIQHDVNGLPWPIVNVLADAGVDTLLMGVNIYCGRTPAPRPRAFRWLGPGGAHLATWHGEHYATADRILRTGDVDVDRAESCWRSYEQRLAADGYDRRWLMLTASDPAFSDNNPPNPQLADLIHAWNQRGLLPRIRFATPGDVRQRLLGETLPVRRGDWSDAWNFGATSTAAGISAARLARSRLLAAETCGRLAGLTPDLRDGWELQSRFLEHTFAPWRCAGYPYRESAHLHAAIKLSHPWKAVDAATMHLRDSLERLAGNPARGCGQSGLLLFNPADEDQTEILRIPAALRDPNRRHHLGAIHALDMERGTWSDERGFDLGPVTVPARSTIRLPHSEWAPVAMPRECRCDESSIRSRAWNISVQQGRLRIIDRQSSLHLDADGPWGFADPIHECVDPDRHPIVSPFWGRDAFVLRDPDRFHNSLSCWISDWPALRSGPSWNSLETARIPGGVELRRTGGLAGTHGVRQTIQLLDHHEDILITLDLDHAGKREPEALYLAFPIAIPAGWQLHYDAAGTMTAIDDDQLPGSCNDWFTSDGAIHVEGGNRRIAIAHPDSALWMPHGFRFGRESERIERPENPMPLAWLTSNYWPTNFAACQPGRLSWRFRLRMNVDAASAQRFGQTCQRPIELHPLVSR